jgi:hypothetical protein
MPMNPRLLRPRAVGSFDPRSIGTMVAWYDFSDTSTLTLVNGFVSEIRNKSGTADTLTQGTEEDRPSLGTLGGRQAGVFDGSNDFLRSTTATPQGSGTLFAAHGLPSANNRALATFSSNISSTVTIFGLQSGASRRMGGQGRFSGSGGQASTVTVASPNTSGVTVFVTASTFDLFSPPTILSNGSTGGGSGTTVGGNQNNQSIGARNTNGVMGAFWDSTVGELLYYQDVLSAAQVSAVENYLKAKWSASY